MPTWVFLWILEFWTWVLTLTGQVLYPLSPASSFINSSGGRKIPKEGGRDIHIRPASHWALDQSCAAFLSTASGWVILTAPNHSLIPSAQQKDATCPQSSTSRQPTVYQSPNRRSVGVTEASWPAQPSLLSRARQRLTGAGPPRAMWDHLLCITAALDHLDVRSRLHRWQKPRTYTCGLRPAVQTAM